MTSARTKPFWMSEWIWPAACQTVRPSRRCQDWAGLSSPAVKNAIRCSSEKAPSTTRSQAGLADAQVGAHRGGVLVVELGQLGLQARGDRHGAGAVRPPRARRSPAGPRRRPRRRWPRRAPAWPSAGRGCAARPARRRAPGRVRAGRPACSASMTLAQPAPPRRRPPCRRRGRRGRRGRGGARPARGRRRSARSRSSRCRAAGRRGPRGGSRSSSWWARTTWTIASVSRMLARNLLPRPSPSLRARGRGRRCRGSRSCRRRARRADGRGDLLEALVDDGHDGDVRLDRRERVVRRLRARPGERVEQRGLARVGHADDADLHRPALPQTVPSTAPAAMSLG